MYRRRSVETLPAHLEEVLGITVAKVQRLDVGVFRVDRRGGTPIVARLFSARRAHEAVLGDLAVLEQLQAAGFPAERPFGPQPLSVHDGQSVLVTHFVRKAAKSALPDGDQVEALGALVGRLHQMPLPAGAADRPGGALHHYAEGTPADHLRAALRGLRDLAPRIADDEHDQLDILRQALAEADDSAGLPVAFVHPDPVPKNAIFTSNGPVLVDWTGSGRGPRLASLALILRSGWAGSRFLGGYATEVELDAQERERAAGILMTRALIDIAFGACREPAKIRQQVQRLPSVRKRTAELAAAALAAG
jgi:Ser/Thr protein kinase RdoA (MazF antagonist)